MRVELQAIIGGLPVGPEEFRAASKGNLICQKEVLPHLLTCASAAGWGRGGVRFLSMMHFRREISQSLWKVDVKGCLSWKR